MDFYVGGYYLVQGHEMPTWMREDQLPVKLWTVSPCICEIYPDSWVFSWSSSSSDNYQRDLRLDNEGMNSLQALADKLMSQEELGWPNVFLDIVVARNFYHQYLKHIPDIKLLSIALSEPYLSEFVEENRPGPNMGEGGVYKKLLQRHLRDNNAIVRGFEVLGDEYGGQFHSFICNSLQTDYSEELNIALNQNGMIDNYEDAIRAAEYTNLDEVGAEPSLWQPWLILEHPL